MNILKKLLPFIIILGLGYFTIKPLFVPGFFPIHDDTQVARVYEMKQSLGDGMFPVRWVSDLGYHYGYPIFNFYAPFAYYVGGIINLFGFDSLVATKIMMGLGIILAGVFMFLLAREFWGKNGGLVSAALYLYAPYHALDIYVRGDIAEFWAYTFIPLIFYGIWKAYVTRKWRFVVVGSIGYACVILSHNLTAMMVTPFVVAFASMLYLWARQEKKIHKPYYPLVILFLGILLASFYWLPVFSEMKFTNVLSQIGGGADYKDHFVCPMQLWNSPWGFGGSTPTCVDGLSYKIGKIHILIFLLSVFGLFFLRKKEKEKFWVGIFVSAALVFSVFLMFSQSKFLWDSIPQMAFFQYPWRFLLVISFFISFMGGLLVYVGARFIKSRILVLGFSAVVIIVIIITNLEIFAPQTITKKTAEDYISKQTLYWATSKISDEYMPPYFVKPLMQNAVPLEKIQNTKGVKIISMQEKTQEISAKIEAEKKIDILVHHAYFPTWHVFIDDKQIEFKHFGKGLIVTIPQGTHLLAIRFAQTPIEMIANGLSITGVLLVILGIITHRKEKNHVKKST
jgi:uncharacterized membrane protein